MATIGFLLLIAAIILQGVTAFTKKVPKVFSEGMLWVSAILLWGEFLARTMAIGFPALTGTFESLIFFSASLITISALYPLQKKVPFLPLARFGAMVVALALLALASSPLAPKDVVPPIPALRSAWLVLHVSFAFIGEALFALSFVAAIVFIFTKKSETRIAADKVTYTSIALGYPIFTAGALVFGAVWAQAAWGRWWGWDPKETWALVTWLFYTLYLHLRLFRKKSDLLTAWIAVIGFTCTLFTFFGVNYLLSGFHSYK